MSSYVFEPATAPAASRTSHQAEEAVGTMPGTTSENGRTPIYDALKLPSMGRRKIPRREMVHLTSQLAIMIRSGVDVVSALESLIKQSNRPVTTEILEEIHHDVVSGVSFSAALAKHGDVFGPTYIASVTAGEASGRMADVLAQLTKLQRTEMRLVRSIRGMVAYPIVLATISMGVILALMIFVLPQFAEIFDQYDAPLPATTRALIAVSNELIYRCWLWIPLAIVGIWAVVYSFRWPPGRRFWDYVVLHVMPIREVTRALLIGRICRLMGLLLESGVPLLDTLGLVRLSVKNSFYVAMLKEIEQNVLSGSGLGKTLLHASFIPPSAAEMLLTAEKTGTLGSASDLIGEHYEEEGEEKMKSLLVVLEPAITVAMGAIVGFVVLSVALPMFDMANVVQQ